MTERIANWSFQSYILTDAMNLIFYRVYKRYPELVSEMFAYSMAAAHEDLPHFIVKSYMVSNTDELEIEGWPWIEALNDDVCEPPEVSSIKDPTTGILRSAFYPKKSLPILLHYCQFYRIGDYEFHKRSIPPELLNCDFPMLHEPPLDLGKSRHKKKDGTVSSTLLLHHL